MSLQYLMNSHYQGLSSKYCSNRKGPRSNTILYLGAKIWCKLCRSGWWWWIKHHARSVSTTMWSYSVVFSLDEIITKTFGFLAHYIACSIFKYTLFSLVKMSLFVDVIWIVVSLDSPPFRHSPFVRQTYHRRVQAATGTHIRTHK